MQVPKQQQRPRRNSEHEKCIRAARLLGRVYDLGFNCEVGKAQRILDRIPVSKQRRDQFFEDMPFMIKTGKNDETYDMPAEWDC